MTTTTISIKGLNKFYGRFQALCDVDLEVNHGEIFGFLGPNGAGKTTTIRCLLDLIRPTTGMIRVLGLDPQAEPCRVQAKTGYLPGELHLDDNLTAGQALKWFDAFHGGGADWKYVQELTERINLNLNTSIKNFSKGNKQKVGIVQAFMHQPELLLLDEPTSGLDPLVQREVLRLVREAKDRGTTVFFSSHVLSEVEEIAERVAIVRRGRIVEIAATDSLRTRDLLHVEVRFVDDVNPDSFADLDGVKIQAENGRRISFEVSGEMDTLIKRLAGFRVHSLATERADLEKVFLAYYSEDEDNTSGKDTP